MSERISRRGVLLAGLGGLGGLAGLTGLSGCSTAPLVQAARPGPTPPTSPTSPASAGAPPRFVPQTETGPDAYLFRSGVPLRTEREGRSRIETAVDRPSLDRFTVGGASAPPRGTEKERAEYACVERVGYGSDHWVSFHIRLGDFVPSTWMLFAQFHDVPDRGEFIIRPPLAFQLDERSRGLSVFARSAPAARRTSPEDEHQVLVYSDTVFTRERWHHLVLRTRFERTGLGRLDLWIDGEQVFGDDIGLGFNDQVAPYFKYGLYRGAAPGIATAEFTNVEIGYASLLERVRAPLPVDATE